jgi:hypothetical protein
MITFIALPHFLLDPWAAPAALFGDERVGGAWPHEPDA